MSVGKKTMSKQGSRNHYRSKGGLKIKVKHGLNICLLLAVCIWLLYQLKQSSYYKKNTSALDSSYNQISEQVLKLGRKDLNPLVDIEISLEKEGSNDKLVRENEIESEDEEMKVEEEEEAEQLEDLIEELDDDNKKENAGLLNNQDTDGEVETNSEKAWGL